MDNSIKNKSIKRMSRLFTILSGGYILINGINVSKEVRLNEFVDSFDDIKIYSFEIDDEHPILKESYDLLNSAISQIPSMRDKITSGELNYCYDLASNNWVSYRKYNSCEIIRISNVPSDKNYINPFCEYVRHSDGSYSITCDYEEDLRKVLSNIIQNDERFDNGMFDWHDASEISYHFSKDGVLLNSVLSSGMFEYVDGDMSKYNFYSTSPSRDKVLYMDKTGEDIVIYDNIVSLYKTSDLDGFNPIISKVSFPSLNDTFLNSFYYNEVTFDSNYKFKNLVYKHYSDDDSNILKIDNSNNILYRDNNKKIVADGVSLSLTSSYFDDKYCDQYEYDNDGKLVSHVNHGHTLFERNGDKGIYYTDDGIIDHVEEENNGMIITSSYIDGVIDESKCDEYVIEYDDGIISSIEALKDDVCITIDDKDYSLNKSDCLTFEDGILDGRKIGDEIWYYYDDGSVSRYKNLLNNGFKGYDRDGNLISCSYCYLNDDLKDKFNPNNLFSDYMNECPQEFNFDIEFDPNEFNYYFSNSKDFSLSNNDSSVKFDSYSFEINIYDGSKYKSVPFKSFRYYKNSFNDDSDIKWYQGTFENDISFAYQTNNKSFSFMNNSNLPSVFRHNGEDYNINGGETIGFYPSGYISSKERNNVTMTFYDGPGMNISRIWNLSDSIYTYKYIDQDFNLMNSDSIDFYDTYVIKGYNINGVVKEFYPSKFLKSVSYKGYNEYYRDGDKVSSDVDVEFISKNK